MRKLLMRLLGVALLLGGLEAGENILLKEWTTGRTYLMYGDTASSSDTLVYRAMGGTDTMRTALDVYYWDWVEVQAACSTVLATCTTKVYLMCAQDTSVAVSWADYDDQPIFTITAAGASEPVSLNPARYLKLRWTTTANDTSWVLIFLTAKRW